MDSPPTSYTTAGNPERRTVPKPRPKLVLKEKLPLSPRRHKTPVYPGDMKSRPNQTKMFGITLGNQALEIILNNGNQKR